MKQRKSRSKCENESERGSESKRKSHGKVEVEEKTALLNKLKVRAKDFVKQSNMEKKIMQNVYN